MSCKTAQILLLLAAVGCAKVGPPSGGPVDREAPRIVKHTPDADATHVATDAPIEIVFSESMNRETVEEAIFIAPDVESVMKWKGNRLHLSFVQRLQENRTYVVTVGSGSRDLRRNSLDESYTFAFATGDEINQGSLVGRVYKDNTPVSGANVWAFDLERLTERTESGIPDYQTQTGRDGGFEFSRLSATRYRIMAFADEDRDQRPDPAEAMGMGEVDLFVEEEGKTAAGFLAIGKAVRTHPRLKRIQAVHDGAILLDFTQPVEAGRVDLKIENLEVSDLYTSPPGGTKVYALTQTQEGGREYRILRLAVGDSLIEWTEPIRGRGRSDKTAPTVLAKHPDRTQIASTDSLRIFFSEAMEPDFPTNFWLSTDSTSVPEGEWSWENASTLSFVFATGMSPGEHRLLGRQSGMKDRSGNPVADSLITFSFTVLDPSLLPSISGLAANDTSRVWVTAEMRGGSQTSYTVVADSTGRYAVTGMVPGSYDVYGYVDRDANGLQDFGSLDPYRPAEPYLRAPEVVELSNDAETMHVDLQHLPGE